MGLSPYLEQVEPGKFKGPLMPQYMHTDSNGDENGQESNINVSAIFLASKIKPHYFIVIN